MDNLQLIDNWDARFSKMKKYFFSLTILLLIYMEFSQSKDYITLLAVNGIFLFMVTRNKKYSLYTDGDNMYLSINEKKATKIPFIEETELGYINEVNSMNNEAVLLYLFILNIFITILDFSLF